jgi:hypothetical protein
MSLATALKGAVADARPLQNPDFRRLWVTQIITMIGAQLTAARLEGPGYQHSEQGAVAAAANYARCCPRPSGLGARPRAGLLAATAGPRLRAGDVWDQLVRRRPARLTSPGWRTLRRQTAL